MKHVVYVPILKEIFPISEMEKKEVLRFAQDVICCDLCPEKQTKNQVEYVCKRCNLNLCTACVGLHVSSDPSSRHDITGYKFKENDGCDNSISCEVHQNKKCELYCKNCKIPICTTCIASNLHTDHIFDEISDSCDRMKAFLREENEDLEGSIAPEYDRLISELQSTITVYKINHENMTREIKNHASQLHSQLNTSMQKLLSNAQKMEVEDMHDLSNLLSKMQRIRSSIQADIEENEKLESGNDVVLLKERVHAAKAGKFRRVPPLIELTTPSFRQPEVDAEMLSKLVGDLIPSVKQTKAGYKIKLPKLGQKETE